VLPSTASAAPSPWGEADADGLDDALPNEPDDLVNARRRAFGREAQLAEKLPAFDPDVLPCADGEVLVVVEEGDVVLAKLREVPAARVDDRAVAVERAIRDDAPTRAPRTISIVGGAPGSFRRP
jgi:hypothetical protein